MEELMHLLEDVNSVIWHNYVLYIVLGVGILFTIRTGIGQFRALTHGTKVVRGVYDDKEDPGAINHFQALSAALSATVGLGNIAGVGVAVALGGPGAVFWMWMVGIFGMAIKMTEVTLSMLYRNTDDPDNPHGGPMFVAHKALAQAQKEGRKAIGLTTGIVFGIVALGFGVLWYLAVVDTFWAIVGGAIAGLALLGVSIVSTKGIGALVGGIFVVTLLISTITGGNMFQSWSVSEITENYFQVPSIASGIVLALLVGLVIIGGIKRIGAVAGRIVPFMCALYLLAALVVLAMNIGEIPLMLKKIVVEAFTPSEASGAFLGGTAGYALLWGMKRALFSSEAGQGSSPIAHSAAKTDEPVREGVVAGLEPFIDTIVVCTVTALVILSTGAYNRGPEATFPDDSPARIVAYDSDDEGAEQDTSVDGQPLWTLETPVVPRRTEEASDVAGEWTGGEDVFVLVTGEDNENTGLNIHRMMGVMDVGEDDEGRTVRSIEWKEFPHPTKPELMGEGRDLYVDYPGPSLTGHAFDRAVPGLGMYLVTLAAWLFALSTAISWSYYGEQGIVYLFGEKLVMPYKFVYCAAIVIASAGFITTDAELDAFTALGTGVMLWANIPIMLIFGTIAMKAYHNYFKRMESGDMEPPHKAPSATDVVEGHDVE